MKLQNEREFIIGMALFKPEIMQREKLNNFNGVMIDALQKSIWRIYGPNRNQQPNKWPKIFSLMKECIISELHYQNHPPILKDIAHVSFHDLKQLNLFAAKIDNLEPLAFLDCPQLQKINLIYNFCPNFIVLNKVHMPSVKIICIYIKHTSFDNHRLQQVIKYPEINFERWGLEINELRLEKGAMDQVMLQDLSKLARSKGSMQNIYICKKYRIEQREVMRTLKRREALQFYAALDDAEFNQYQI